METVGCIDCGQRKIVGVKSQDLYGVKKMIFLNKLKEEVYLTIL